MGHGFVPGNGSWTPQREFGSVPQGPQGPQGQPGSQRTQGAQWSQGPQAPGQFDGCVVIRSEGSYQGRQGVNLSTGVSAATVGSRKLCLHLVVIPPGTRGTPHLHDGHETAIWISTGEVEVWHGTGLADRTVLRAGDFLYVPPGTPHLPVNWGDVPMVSVIARTDAAEQESVVVLDLPPHLADLENVPIAAG